MPGIRLGLGLRRRRFAERWTPVDTATEAWFRADLGVTGSPLTAWADQSGNARNIGDPGAGKRPAVNATGAPNSLPCIDFDGANDTLNVAFARAQPVTVFMVVLPSASGAVAGTMADGNVGNDLRIYNLGGPTRHSIFFGTASITVAVGNTNTWRYIEATANGASSAIRVNGAAPGSGNAGAAAPNGITMGTFGNGAADPCDCCIAEYIMVAGAVSAGLRAQFEGYFLWRYGL